jgi:hypothetical protein
MPTERQLAVVTFASIRPDGVRQQLSVEQLVKLVAVRQTISSKLRARGFSPTAYREQYSYTRPDRTCVSITAPVVHRCNEGVERLSMVVLDIDHAPLDIAHLKQLGVLWIAFTTWSHSESDPRGRVIVPLSRDVPSDAWPRFWFSAAELIHPHHDSSVGDLSRFYFVHSCPPERVSLAETMIGQGPLLDPRDVPLVELPPAQAKVLSNYEPAPLTPSKPSRRPTHGEQHRALRLLGVCVQRLAAKAEPGRQVYAYGLAHLLGHWVGAGALDHEQVRAALWAAAQSNGAAQERPAELERAIARGLAKGQQAAVDLDADRFHAAPRRRRTSA